MPLRIAIAKGRIFEEALSLFRQAGIVPQSFQPAGHKLRHRIGEELEVLIVRATDVPTYVYRGACDVGLVGSDTLAEGALDLMELADLGVARCQLCIARPQDVQTGRRAGERLRVATKYPRLTAEHFSGIDQPVEIVKLYGSLELAPSTGISDVIVDLVDTGRTLAANGLVVDAKIMDVSCRMVANRSSYYRHLETIGNILDALRRQEQKRKRG